MSDTYQAVFDAVRSKISGGDLGEAVERAIREMNLSHYVEMAGHAIVQAAVEVQECQTSPSAIYRPAICIDGNQWCALYGADLQCGVAGFGDTPAAAIADFDKNWRTPLRNSPSGLAKASI